MNFLLKPNGYSKLSRFLRFFSIIFAVLIGVAVEGCRLAKLPRRSKLCLATGVLCFWRLYKPIFSAMIGVARHGFCLAT